MTSRPTSGVSLGIAIPSFNQGTYVVESLASIRQLQTPFQAIIQDGGSDRETLAAIESSIAGDDRFSLVVETDEGQSDAINRAWARLRTDHPLLTWINTDDLVHAEQYDLLLTRLADSDAAAAYGDFITIDGDGNQLAFHRRPGRVTRPMLRHWRNDVPGVGVAIRTDALDRIGGAMNTSLHYAMDFDLWLRLVRVGPLRRLAGVTGSSRLHDGSKTTVDGARTRAEIFALAAADGRAPEPWHSAARLAWRAVGRVGRTLGPWREGTPLP